ncbi:hypothetical protein, partial [Pseudomonas carnis]|uniref:hypothetical protein n=1 Tax=Pseudomonas carnis TaxID=2487355 RepID=UPI001C2FDE8C
RRPLLLLAATIAGSFVWQLTGVYGAILLLSLHLKSQGAGDVQLAAEALDRKNRQTLAFRAFTAIAIATISVIALSQLAAALETRSAVHELAILLTGLPSLIVVVLALWILIGPVLLSRSPRALLAEVPLHCFILAGAALLVPQIAFAVLSNPDAPNPSGVLYVLKLIVFPLTGRGKVLMPFLAATLL